MFSQACVILFTGGGVCLSACWDTTLPEQTPAPQSRHPPAADTPLGADTPLEQAPNPPGADTPLRADTPRADTPLEQTPPVQSMLGDTVNARAVCILLECNLVSFDFMRIVWWRLSYTVFEFFTNAKHWHHWHYCQLCIPIYLQFRSLYVIIRW